MQFEWLMRVYYNTITYCGLQLRFEATMCEKLQFSSPKFTGEQKAQARNVKLRARYEETTGENGKKFFVAITESK